MKKVRTVSGDIAPDQLGWCQCHEHLFLEKGKSYTVNAALCMDNEKKSILEIMRYKAAGGHSFVDAQPGGCGRMAEAMVRASKEAGVNIIASTGFHKLCFFEEDSRVSQMDEDALTAFFVSEINDGMRTSRRGGQKLIPAKAGIIKVAVDKGGIKTNAVYEKLFRSAIQAAKATGVSILAHFEPDTDVFELIHMMDAEGVEASRLLACHLDRARYDISYHKEVAQTGAFLEYDTIHRLNYHNDETEIALIKAMIEEGLTDHLLLSLDTTASRLIEYGGEIGLDYILTTFDKQLEHHGIGVDVLHKVMVENPTKALAF